MRISDWSSDVCSSDLAFGGEHDVRRVEITMHQYRSLPHIVGDQGVEGIAQYRLLGFVQYGLAVLLCIPFGENGQFLAQPLRIVGQIGRASGRERVCQYVYISVVAVPLKKKKTQ